MVHAIMVLTRKKTTHQLGQSEASHKAFQGLFCLKISEYVQTLSLDRSQGLGRTRWTSLEVSEKMAVAVVEAVLLVIKIPSKAPFH